METGHIIQHRYQIVQVLGHGGMGTTYKAIDLQTEDPVAVKRLHFFQMKAWKALEMFEREAKILQQLNHPRIPKYLDYFSVETSEDVEFVLVQEYIEGQTLQQLVEDGWKRTESEILDLFLQLVNILDYLHALFPPVIHRDINPKNIILSPNNEVYLVDFGAVQEKIRTTFLGGSTIVGTYGYVPFEQFTGKAVPASDYYALGATLLYMLTHKHPADFPTERLRLVFHDSVQASPTMIHLLEELLEPSVKRRLASSEQVRELLTEQSTESQEQLVNVSKPITLKIKKVTRASDCILFRMPNRTNIVAAVLFGSFGAWLLTAFLISLFTNAWDSLPFSLLICLPACGGTLYSLCKRAVLELTPEWVWLSRKSFGIGSSQCVLTAELRRKDVTWYLENGKPVLVINHAGKALRISSERLKLTQADIEWLVQEINEYVSTYAKPLPVDQREVLVNNR